jgi:hypothetical protein
MTAKKEAEMPTKKTGNVLVSKYLRMWPREIFDRADVIEKGKKKLLDDELKQPGVTSSTGETNPITWVRRKTGALESARTPPAQ